MTEDADIAALKSKIEDLSQHRDELANAPFAATATHTGSIIVEANQAFADLVNYTVDQLIGLNAWTLFPPESYPLLMQKLQTKSEKSYEVMAQDRHGKAFAIEMYGVNHEWKGEPARTVHVRDITERKAVEHELSKTKRAYQHHAWMASHD